MAALHAEIEYKFKNIYGKIHRYGDIKGKFKNLKISPVSMIPHKSRAFRTILDILFQLQHLGKLMESLNLATTKQAPDKSMVQLGKYVQRLIALLANNYDPVQPFLFSRLDIKDEFWRLAVSNKDALNFSTYYRKLRQ